MKNANELIKVIEATSWVIEDGDAHDLIDAVEQLQTSCAKAFTYIQRLESELEPLRKAKENNRLIILPYTPGTPVYVVDDYEVVQMKYHPSMYGRRCNISEEELYKEWYKELENNGTESKNY